jgi:hypothetical protein
MRCQGCDNDNATKYINFNRRQFNCCDSCFEVVEDAFLKIEKKLQEDKKLELCKGCRDDFYNNNGKKCWSLTGATLVQRTRVGTWQNPPYKWEPEETLGCHHPEGQHWITENDPRIRES